MTGIAAVLARLGWWIIPAAALIAAPFLLLGRRSGRSLYDLERRISEQRRRGSYLSEEILQGRDAAAERVLFAYSGLVTARWRTAFDRMRRLTVLSLFRYWFHIKAAETLTVGLLVAAMLALLRPLQTGAIDVAFYVAAVMAIWQAQRAVAMDLSVMTMNLAQHGAYFKDLTSFSALAERERSLTRRASHEPFESLEFKGVSFTYPDTTAPVLRDVSFVMERGGHYALVGANGSGKSTLTKLSREFGTRDLSLGQWQRLAIARGLFRRHDTIVLDEPTASIDPLEEQAVYERFMTIAAGRTALIVTHRLASARLADRILVLDGGRTVEDGTHRELLARGGLYHRMFTAQAAWYDRPTAD